MELTGKITTALPQRKGVSQRTGTEWVSQTFILETLDQYPRHLAFDIFGADRLASLNPQVGEICTVQFDIDAHEYQGRWYNSIRAWRIDRGDAMNQGAAPVAPAAAAPVAAAAPAASPTAAPAMEDNGDDLPF